MGGDDSSENLAYLTPEEHAQAHLELYEKYGRYEDAQAYNILAAQWLTGRTIDGYKQSEEHVRKRTSATDYQEVSKKLKGRISPTKGMKFGEYSEERRKNISNALKGKPHSEDRKNKISKALTGKESPTKIECYCIFCKKRVPPSRFDRHGIDKLSCITKEQYDKLYVA